jgi:hypothetical protein
MWSRFKARSPVSGETRKVTFMAVVESRMAVVSVNEIVEAGNGTAVDDAVRICPAAALAGEG